MSLRIAIIGAGVAGVSAGRLLADRGHSVTLLEKSRGCGGRCATKRWEGHVVDHGAQYFTLRHAEFSAAVQQACGEALCREAYAVTDHTSDLAWSACGNHKAGRIGAGCTVMVAQMSEAFSRRHLESPPENYPALVRAMVERRWGLSSGNVLAAFGHRWRYARLVQPHAEPTLPDRCYFAGDALTASRIEDAWLAGRATARKIIQSQSNH